MDTTEALRLRVTELESRERPSAVDAEMLGRLYRALGHDDRARAAFRRVAEGAEADQAGAGFVVPTSHLYLGNLRRLAGDDAQATEHLLRSRDLLESKAQASDRRKPPFLFTLFLLGDDDGLLAAADVFGETACGERAWAVVEAVRAHRAGDGDELDRRLADLDASAAAERVDIDGRHPSDRDLRDLLRSRLGAGPADDRPASAPVPTPTVRVEDPVGGDVIGWWGPYVVSAADHAVTLYDVDAGRIAHRIDATAIDGVARPADAAVFTSGRSVYVLTTTSSGVTAVVLEPGGSCSSVGGLVGVESGLDAAVWRADGSQVAAGRPPVALAPDGRRLAIGGPDGATRCVTLDDDLAVVATVDIGPSCSALAWFPDGDRLACAIETSQTVRTVAVPSGDVLDEAVLHDDDPIVAVAVAPSGTMVASVGFDGILGVRDLDRGLSLRFALGDRLEDLAWDSSGESIAVLGQNGWFVVTSTGQRLDLGPASSLAWHPTERSLAIARDGRLSVLEY